MDYSRINSYTSRVIAALWIIGKKAESGKFSDSKIRIAFADNTLPSLDTHIYVKSPKIGEIRIFSIVMGDRVFIHPGKWIDYLESVAIKAFATPDNPHPEEEPPLYHYEGTCDNPSYVDSVFAE